MQDKLKLTSLPSGTLEECINKYSKEQLELIASWYGKKRVLNGRTKVGGQKYIVNLIKEELDNILEDMSDTDLATLRDLITNKEQDINTIEEEFILMGVVFISNNSYYIPSDLKETLKNKVELLLANIMYDSIVYYLSQFFILNGPIPIDKFITEFASDFNEKIDKESIKERMLADDEIKDNLKEIDGILCFSDSRLIDMPECDKIYHKQSLTKVFDEELTKLIDVYDKYTKKLQDILGISYLEAMKLFIRTVLLEEKNESEIADEIFSLYNLNLKKATQVKAIFSDMPKIYYWTKEYPKLGQNEPKIINLENSVKTIFITYLLINGIMKKEDAIKCIKRSGFDTSISELDDIATDMKFQKDNNNYYLMNYDDDEIMAIKDNMASNDFKIISFEESHKINNLISEVSDKIDEIMANNNCDYSAKANFKGTIIYALHRGIYSDRFLMELVKSNNFRISKSEKEAVFNYIDTIKNDFPVWIYNGYSKKEKNMLPKVKKIGRNDPCSCGSGKKYKHCCGK